MAIFDVHHPLAFTFGILGNLISLMVYFAPLPTFVRIYKNKSTMGFDSLPYAVGLFSAMLWMYYAFLAPNSTLLITINSFGCFIETLYLSIFIFYASKKARAQALKILAIMNLGLSGLIFGFTYFMFKGDIRIQVVGWICVVFAVSVFAAPLKIVVLVVRTRSVEFMPLPLSITLTLTAVIWFCYGFFKHDLCVAIPNVLGFLLGMMQMILYAIYRNSKPRIEDKKLPELTNITSILQSPEPEDRQQKSRNCTCQQHPQPASQLDTSTPVVVSTA